jgi:hypothetical protein
VAKVPIDTDASDDTEAFSVGKAFHLCLEMTMHELDGFTLADCRKFVMHEGFGLDESHVLMIFAMLAKYKDIHEQAGLKAIAVETPIDTPDFYGIVDAILQDEKGGWWVSDSKTAASYSPSLDATLPFHPQLNLYANYHFVLAETLDLVAEQFKGCRYRLVTKSKLVQKTTESTQSFLARLSGSVRGFDFVLPKDRLDHMATVTSHMQAKRHIDTFKNEEAYPPSYGNCMSYFRPCEFWSRCHGCNISTTPELEVFKS